MDEPADKMLNDAQIALGIRVDAHVPDDVPQFPWPRKPIDGHAMTGGKASKGARTSGKQGRAGKHGGRGRTGRQAVDKHKWHPW